MFFRTKKVKGIEYAYIVENKWKKSSQQKVKEYLGRVFRFEILFENSFPNGNDLSNYLEHTDFSKIVKELVEWEFVRHKIPKDFYLDFENFKLQKSKKNVVVLINDGFMCGKTLKNLIEFQIEGDEETDGYRLARAFVEAGIKVPNEIFVGLFGKLYKTKEQSK